MEMTRRALLRTTALVPVAVAVNACAQLQQAVALAPAIAQDAALIAQALKGVMPTIETLTGLAGGAKNTIASLINTVDSTASQIAGAAGPTVSSLVTTLGSAVGDIAGLITGNAGVPSIVNSVIAEALSLLPAIESAVGITAPAARRFAAVMTPDQARTALQAFVAR